jgi:hypothetical protein
MRYHRGGAYLVRARRYRGVNESGAVQELASRFNRS